MNQANCPIVRYLYRSFLLGYCAPAFWLDAESRTRGLVADRNCGVPRTRAVRLRTQYAQCLRH